MNLIKRILCLIKGHSFDTGAIFDKYKIFFECSKCHAKQAWYEFDEPVEEY